MFKTRFTVFLVLVLAFLPRPLAAQGDGQYVILSAQYGHERHHVDVTDRLRELARAGRRFKVSNKDFGIDPDPGVKKTLRIYARGPNGQEQMFEYSEGSVIDGRQFRGWRGGDWGSGGWSGNWNGGGDRDRDRDRDHDRDRDEGQYLILSAQYGHERRHVDVTDRLKELARADRPFQVRNDVFGVDPDPGVVKTLRIYHAARMGRNRCSSIREGSVVDGRQFRGWRGGDWGHGGWSGHWNGPHE